MCPRGRIFNGKVRNYATQRTDTSVQATRMHCMDHKHSIHNAKVCWSFRWIKQYTHLSVARFWRMCPRGEDFQRKSQKLRYLTDRYMCTSSAHILYGSQAHHPWCQSVLICPLDQVSDSLVRWKMWNFPTEKSGNYAIQRTDTSVQATRMHCMDHKRAIHNVKVFWSFRWVKQYIHLSVAKLLIESNSFDGWYQRWVCITIHIFFTAQGSTRLVQ